jgi:hypothetical protein
MPAAAFKTWATIGHVAASRNASAAFVSFGGASLATVTSGNQAVMKASLVLPAVSLGAQADRSNPLTVARHCQAPHWLEVVLCSRCTRFETRRAFTAHREMDFGRQRRRAPIRFRTVFVSRRDRERAITPAPNRGKSRVFRGDGELGVSAGLRGGPDRIA